jgi:hypothetical protein
MDGRRAVAEMDDREAGPSALFTKPQRRRINAIAFPSWRGTVGEYMAQMGVAPAAQHLCPFHKKAAIYLGSHIFFGGWSPKARPSGAGIEFFSRAKKDGAAADTTVHALLMVIPITPSERGFGPLPPGYGKFFRGEFPLPFGVAFDNFFHWLRVPFHW